MRMVELVSYAPGNRDLWIGSFHAMWSVDTSNRRFFAIAFGAKRRHGFKLPLWKAAQ